MSRSPDQAGVRELRMELKKLHEVRGEYLCAQAAASRLGTLESEVNRSIARIVKMLEEMDAASNGNCGWEGRIIWLLQELCRQESAGDGHAP